MGQDLELSHHTFKNIHTIFSSFPPHLKAWVGRAEEESDGPSVASLVAQVLEGCPLPKLVALIAQNDAASGHLIAAAHLIATLPAHHDALLSAGLPRALIAAASPKVPPPPAGALPTDSVRATAFKVLGMLLRGPASKEAADAVVAADGLEALVASLSEGGEVGESAARCLLALTEGGATHHPAVVAAGAVPPLVAAVKSGEEAGSGWAAAAAAAARTLLNLMATQAAAEREAAAAGFDAAALRAMLI